MPQVHWPKRTNRNGGPVQAVLAVVLVLGLLGSTYTALKPQAAQGAQQLPDPSLVTPGDAVSLVIAQNSNGFVVNAPVSWAKIYFSPSDPGPTGNVQIWNAPYDPCNNTRGDPDWEGPLAVCAGLSDALADQVRYDFYAVTDNQETPSAVPIFTVDGQTGRDLGGVQRLFPSGLASRNGWSTVAVPMGGIVSAITGFKVVYVKAYFPGGLGARVTKLHSFRLNAPGAQDDAGYWAQAGTSSGGVKPALGEYAVHYIGPKVDYRVPSIGFNFAPPCNLSSPQTASLRWFDADNGAGSPTNFDFYQIAPGNPTPQLVINVNNSSVPNLGGNNVFSEYVFTAQPGYKYEWIWHNILSVHSNGNAGNNIQFWLPYDSINFDNSCFDYHSTINGTSGGGVASGTPAAPANLDFSNAANLNLLFHVNLANTLAGAGPAAFVSPRVYVKCPPVPAPCPGSVADAGPPTTSWGNYLTTPIAATIPGNGSIPNAGQITYSLDPNTKTGTVLCFGDHITPNRDPLDAGIDNDPPDACYKIINDVRFPGVVGYNMDIHAGGGLCPAQTPGSIQGNASAASLGQYVLSAAPVGGVGGLINNFGSDNAAGSTTLNIGKAGGYLQVCRPDLYKYAESKKDFTNPVMHPLAPGCYTIDATWSGAYFANGPVCIKGTVSNKVTIVMESGDLTIAGDLILSHPGVGPRAAPSLGIITNGPGQSVFINPAAHRVDAYLFSNGTIDTCGTAAVFAPPGCDNTLVVNGFLMANKIYFKRLGPNSVAPPAQTGEQIQFSPQLFLNPPYFFDSGADNNSIQGLGELPPLF